jgi:hypothetical protein
MKTLKHKENGSIRRVENKEADMFTAGSNPVWEFVSKSVWKLNRKTSSTEKSSDETPKNTKASKKNENKKNRKGN